MSRILDQDKPFSKEDIEYCHTWALDHLIAENERRHGQAKVHAAGEPVDVQKALDKAKIEVPDQPPQPTYVGAQGGVGTGPVVVEGEETPARSTPVRDHPLTGTVYENDPVLTGQADAVDDDVEEVDIDELNVEELKDELRKLGESTGGNKEELQKRLKKALG